MVSGPSHIAITQLPLTLRTLNLPTPGAVPTPAATPASAAGISDFARDEKIVAIRPPAPAAARHLRRVGRKGPAVRLPERADQ